MNNKLRIIHYFLILAFFSLPLAAADKTARVNVPEEIYEFGTLAQGATIEFDFVIENRGDADLKIHGVYPDCGCTVVKNPDIIAPGKSEKIRVTLDTMDLSGTVSKRILIMTNDPKRSELTLFIAGKIKAYVEILPKPFLVFNHLLSETVDKSVYLVTEKEGNDFEVLKTECSLPHVEVIKTILPNDQRFGPFPNRQYLLTLRINPNAPLGYEKGTLLIYTNVKEQPVKRMYVTTMIRPDIMATPFDLHFGERPSNKGAVSRLVWVSDNTGEIAGFKVLSIETDHDFVTTEITPMPNHDRVQVRVTLKLEAPLGPFEGEITIRTNAPQKEYKELIVNYSGEILK